nr:hypothetical protein HMPREF0276_2326 [Corynebacterium accolens ATCC 49725]
MTPRLARLAHTCAQNVGPTPGKWTRRGSGPSSCGLGSHTHSHSKGTTVVASCIHQTLTVSYRYTTLKDATDIAGKRPRVLPHRTPISEL